MWGITQLVTYLLYGFVFLLVMCNAEDNTIDKLVEAFPRMSISRKKWLFNEVFKNFKQPAESSEESEKYNNNVKRRVDDDNTEFGGDDPCDPYNPKRPRFLKHGIKISEAKCTQYVWDLKTLEERERRGEECRRRHNLAGVSGGRVAKRKEFPHMGAVGWPTKNGWSFQCGSFLISHKFLLTAAHCYETTSTDVTDVHPKIVRLGVKNLRDDTAPLIDMEIESFIQHDLYEPPSKYYDIALIKLKHPVKFNTYVRPACLWNRFDLMNYTTAYVTGWGVTQKGVYTTTTSPKLKVAQVDILHYKDCADQLRLKKNELWPVLRKHQMCTSSAAKSQFPGDSCRGDSGGPLQVQIDTGTKLPVYRVMGVTSFGFGCASPFPSVYTRVSTAVDWIEKTVWSIILKDNATYTQNNKQGYHRRQYD